MLTALEDEIYQPTPEEERDYWCGKGHLIFHVLSYDPTKTYCPYEIDYDDYSGCVGGLGESLGIEYAVNEGILDVGKLQIGMTYEVQGITAHFNRGDGWTTDDDMGMSNFLNQEDKEQHIKSLITTATDPDDPSFIGYEIPMVIVADPDNIEFIGA